jgi:hypothetical protein
MWTLYGDRSMYETYTHILGRETEFVLMKIPT